MNKNTFGKHERLKSRKSIESVFRTGSTIFSPPFRLLYRKVEDQESLKMTVAVPRKLVKRAVDRNKIKRRTREAYRTKKETLLTQLHSTGKESYELVFLYQSQDIADSKRINSAINFLLIKLQERLK